jgi:NADH-quinone oxidoreductase subunit L
MTVPLVILSVFALGVGAYFEWTEGFAALIAHTPSLAYQPVARSVEHAAGSHVLVMAISTVCALAGVGIAAFLYLGDQQQVDALTRVLSPLYWLSYGKLFIDPIYNVLFVWPLWLVAQLCYAIDRFVVDGIVNLVGRIPLGIAAGLRSLQTGMVQFYALAMVWGVVVLAITLLVWPTIAASMR